MQRKNWELESFWEDLVYLRCKNYFRILFKEPAWIQQELDQHPATGKITWGFCFWISVSLDA